MRKPEQLHERLFIVDYLSQFKDAAAMRPRIHLSFSFLHWRIIEQLITKEEKIDEIDRTTFERILATITPTGQSVLHIGH